MGRDNTPTCDCIEVGFLYFWTDLYIIVHMHIIHLYFWFRDIAIGESGQSDLFLCIHLAWIRLIWLKGCPLAGAQCCTLTVHLADTTTNNTDQE